MAHTYTFSLVRDGDATDWEFVRDNEEEAQAEAVLLANSHLGESYEDWDDVCADSDGSTLQEWPDVMADRIPAAELDKLREAYALVEMIREFEPYNRDSKHGFIDQADDAMATCNSLIHKAKSIIKSEGNS